MVVIPAIDLKGGKVVRLRQGCFNQRTTYSNDPISTARYWQSQGAKYLHVVDLDGAKTGRVCHLDLIKRITRSVKIPVQVGGGLRQEESIKQILGCGVSRVVLGSKLQDEVFLRRALKRFKQRVIVSVDARDTLVRISGWRKPYKALTVLDSISRLEDIGFEQIIYTDIARDGTMKGPNIAMIKRILKNSGISVIASGGIGSLSDLSKLKALSKQGLIGVIIGKALYEGRFTLKEALKYA